MDGSGNYNYNYYGLACACESDQHWLSCLLQCWAPYRTKAPRYSNNNLNSLNLNSPRVAPTYPLLLSTVKILHFQMSFTFSNQSGASTNATATNGRLSELRCGFVLRHGIYLSRLFIPFFFRPASRFWRESDARSRTSKSTSCVALKCWNMPSESNGV